MVLVGNSWVLFLSGGELSYRDQWSWWAIVGFYFYPELSYRDQWSWWAIVGELSYRDQWSWWVIVGFYFYPVGSCPIGISGPGGQ